MWSLAGSTALHLSSYAGCCIRTWPVQIHSICVQSQPLGIMLVNKHGQPSLWPGKHLCYTNACVTAAGKDSIMQFTALIQLLGREGTLLHTVCTWNIEDLKSISRSTCGSCNWLKGRTLPIAKSSGIWGLLCFNLCLTKNRQKFKSISGNISLKWAHVTFLLGAQLMFTVVLRLLNPQAPNAE